jgi:hypothetical protein
VICAIHNAYYWLNKSLIRSGYHGYAMIGLMCVPCMWACIAVCVTCALKSIVEVALTCAMCHVRGLVLLFVSLGIALKSIVEVALTVRLSEWCRLRNIM